MAFNAQTAWAAGILAADSGREKNHVLFCCRCTSPSICIKIKGIAAARLEQLPFLAMKSADDDLHVLRVA